VSLFSVLVGMFRHLYDSSTDSCPASVILILQDPVQSDIGGFTLDLGTVVEIVKDAAVVYRTEPRYRYLLL
jgi:hypothetical protein